MLCKRIIPCLDVAAGRTVKGVNFRGLRDVGDPVELAVRYEEQGADELVFLDVSASVEGRGTMVEAVRRVARELRIPFTVGGGVSSLEDVKRLLGSGADKVSVNTAAVARPALIGEIAEECGSQCCVLAVDARRGVAGRRAEIPNPKSQTPMKSQISNLNGGPGWEVLVRGGRDPAGLDALAWAREAVDRGAGEVLLTSWDRDGTLAGFDLGLTAAFATSLPVPVIASGGASGPESFVEVFREGKADAALAASIFHDGTWTVAALKEVLRREGIEVRL
ncbi:MAG: imidazole glycerol phosphate synthase subunit HisF [Planctomycetes bacterium]|jgi:cyclase|nr:imidazole glycerol phosphate synthase subunit HisF [Planctomycetota bacterium]